MRSKDRCATTASRRARRSGETSGVNASVSSGMSVSYPSKLKLSWAYGNRVSPPVSFAVAWRTYCLTRRRPWKSWDGSVGSAVRRTRAPGVRFTEGPRWALEGAGEDVSAAPSPSPFAEAAHIGAARPVGARRHDRHRGGFRFTRPGGARAPGVVARAGASMLVPRRHPNARSIDRHPEKRRCARSARSTSAVPRSARRANVRRGTQARCRKPKRPPRSLHQASIPRVHGPGSENFSNSGIRF